MREALKEWKNRGKEWKGCRSVRRREREGSFTVRGWQDGGAEEVEE